MTVVKKVEWYSTGVSFGNGYPAFIRLQNGRITCCATSLCPSHQKWAGLMTVAFEAEPGRQMQRLVGLATGAIARLSVLR